MYSISSCSAFRAEQNGINNSFCQKVTYAIVATEPTIFNAHVSVNPTILTHIHTDSFTRTDTKHTHTLSHTDTHIHTHTQKHTHSRSRIDISEKLPALTKWKINLFRRYLLYHWFICLIEVVPKRKDDHLFDPSTSICHLQTLRSIDAARSWTDYVPWTGIGSSRVL